MAAGRARAGTALRLHVADSVLTEPMVGRRARARPQQGCQQAAGAAAARGRVGGGSPILL
jgi:hypothetical protein